MEEKCQNGIKNSELNIVWTIIRYLTLSVPIFVY